ncbi:MAG: VTT domain-containing protein, partial [Ruminococcus sp.]|nr:VTT domain-containing protein [Ruminococcus sp.]
MKDYRKLCLELFGTDDEAELRKIAGRLRGGRKKALSEKDIALAVELQGKGKLSAIFAIRFLPVFPIDLVSLFLGAVKMKFLPYFLVSIGGILPRVILFTILG